MNFPLLSSTKTRIISARWWLITQLFLTAVLVALAVVFLRLPDKYLWQVLITLLLPLALCAVFVLMQSCTMHALVGTASMDKTRQVKLIFGAMTFVAWILLAWVALTIAFDFGDKIDLYAGYLNSRFPAGLRAKIFTEDHIASIFNSFEWLMVYVLIPGLFIPLATLTSITGAGLPKLSELK